MNDLELLALDLKMGGLLFYPTDTCLGLGHDIYSELGQERLYEFKKMDAMKPVSILVKDKHMARRYGFLNDLALSIWDEFMPGALTMLVPKTDCVPNYLNPASDYIGIRCIDSNKINNLIDLLGNPISTTSANISGQFVVSNLDEFFTEFGSDLDYVNFMVPKTTEYSTTASTIVKIEGDRLVVVRAGELLEKFNKKFGAYID